MNNKQVRPFPLGATPDSAGCNFSVHAPNVADIRLALFNINNEFVSYQLKDFEHGIKAIYIEGVTLGQEYGFIVPFKDSEILLSDPYAKSLSKSLHYSPPYSSDKSWKLAKSVVTCSKFDWQGIDRPRRSREGMIIFEAHIKGLTKINPNLPESKRGTYGALAHQEMIAFYEKQGINTIQLLPIAACMHEPHLLEKGMKNYWGYNPFVFMSPDPRYAEADAVVELKTAIRELHRNEIEIILDVVFNHTAEGGEDGPNFNLKIFDPLHYLMNDDKFSNFTGCGNTLNLTHQPTLNLVLDSLRHWVQDYQIDGFRFDLAATLGRNGDHFNQKASFFQAIAQDPILRDVKLIAEPWDIGPNGYQVGNFPDGWNECNDKFRDVIRSFWRGDQGYLKEFATRIMGSRDIYSAGRWPEKLTVNYVTYHDGFTLQDLVSYNHKNNLINGEENRDGHSDNRSDNCGVEGSTNNMLIKAKREKQKRNFMASLLFSFGIPHILTADLVSHTQEGNNNAYCQDNEISWLNWDLSRYQNHFKEWVASLMVARTEYMLPFVRAFSGPSRNNNRVTWLRPDGTVMTHDDWNIVSAIALHMGIGQNGKELLYLINQSNVPARYQLPASKDQHWQVVCDTSLNLTTHRRIIGEQLIPPKTLVVLHN